MKLPLLPLLIIAILIFNNCQKTTTAKGRVYNYVSGKPIANMPVILTGYDGNKPRDSVNPNPCEIVETKTDANGEYDLEVGCSGMDKASIRIGNVDHTSPFSNFFWGAISTSKLRFAKNNEIDFQVDSVDGKINFIFHNLKVMEDTIYIHVHCDAIGKLPSYYCGGQKQIAVPAGATSSQLSFVTANRYIKYYWDTVPFTGINATHVDSIYCARNDSITCNISF